MKTPTTLYLAYRGWFAANVPIVAETPLPTIVFELDPQRVFCLRTEPARLRELRQVRAEAERIPAEPYTAPEYIRREMARSGQLAAENGWRLIATTGKSVEEISREIIALLPHRE